MSAAAVALVWCGWSLSFPGCLSLDEVTYLLSARSLAGGTGVEVWNGFEEFPSPELAPGWLKVVDGRLVSQYPDFHLFLALPAYRALGFRGLFVVNVLAFAGLLALTWDLARRLFGGRVALVAIGLLGLSTFAFEYAVAAWPHMTSALFVLAALALVERASFDAGPGRSMLAAAGAGLLIGFGAGVRLDVVVAGAALGAALLLLRPVRFREAPAFAGMELFNGAGMCNACHVSDGGATLFTDFTFDNLGTPRNPDNPFYDMDEVYLPDGNPINPDGEDWIDYGLGGYLKSAGYGQEVYAPEMGKFKVLTLRSVGRRPADDFVKAYGHNGYFKSLDEIVTFYHWRAMMDNGCMCGGEMGGGCMGGGGMGGGGMGDGCMGGGGMGGMFPDPEVDQNRATLKMFPMMQIDNIVAFLKTLSDGYLVSRMKN